MPEQLAPETPLTWSLQQSALQTKTAYSDDQSNPGNILHWDWELDGYWFVENGVLEERTF